MQPSSILVLVVPYTRSQVRTYRNEKNFRHPTMMINREQAASAIAVLLTVAFTRNIDAFTPLSLRFRVAQVSR